MPGNFLPVGYTMIYTVWRRLLVSAGWIGLAVFLWYFRSWNLDIGDGLFCCKQTIGPLIFPITLSRAPLAYLLYRFLFFTLYPILDWWVEDIIALSSVAAGLVFYYALYRLVWSSIPEKGLRIFFLLFPGSSMVLNMFCGHIEFYPWTNALLMVSVFWAWRTIRDHHSPLLPSTALALATAFHSSAIFYFPALLVLPFYRKHRDSFTQTELRSCLYAAGVTFFLFMVFVLLHRVIFFQFSFTFQIPTFVFFLLFGILLGAGYYFYPGFRGVEVRDWLAVLIPWFVLFAARSFFQLRAEPLIEHLPPFREPYDHGAYLYMFFSRYHLYDKTMFHLWLAPFGLVLLVYFSIKYMHTILKDGWLQFLFQFSIWALIWSTLFYPQLRTRDWDLFVSMAIPLNLFAMYGMYYFFPRSCLKSILSLMIVVHLCISVPVMIRNSAVLTDRGYVTLEYAPEPVQSRAFLRSLELGTTPLRQENIRAGEAEVRIIPLQRGYQSWDRNLYLEPGETYRFAPELEPIDNTIPPEFLEPQEEGN